MTAHSETSEPTRKNLTAEERFAIEFFAAQGKTQTEIAEAIGRDRKTVGSYMKANQVEIASRRSELADQFELMAKFLLQSIQAEDLTRMSPAQRITAAAIAVDKMRLLKGQPTSLVGGLQAVIKITETKASLADAIKKLEEKFGPELTRLIQEQKTLPEVIDVGKAK